MIDEECEHVPKPLTIDGEWEHDKVMVTVECRYCDGSGQAPARLVYEEEVVWFKTVEPKGNEVTEDVPLP